MGASSEIAAPPLYERYEALIRVSQAISAHRDPKELFCAMARELRQVVQFDGIVIAQFDQASSELLWSSCQVDNQDQPTTPPSVPADESIEECLFIMREFGFRHLPIVEGKELKGLVSLRDVLMHQAAEIEKQTRRTAS